MFWQIYILIIIAYSLMILYYLPEILQKISKAGSELGYLLGNRERMKQLKSFWSKYNGEKFVTIVPPEDIDPLRKGTQVFGFMGLWDLIDFLSKTFDELEVKKCKSDKVSQNQLLENLILSGGPIPNKISREILKQTEIEYTFGGKNEHHIKSKNRPDLDIEPHVNEEKNVTRDFGIITRAKNPYNLEKDVILCCGQFGWGTLAGFRLLKEKKPLQYLENVGEYFQVIYTVRVDEENTPMNPHLLDLHPDENLRKETAVSLYNSKEE